MFNCSTTLKAHGSGRSAGAALLRRLSWRHRRIDVHRKPERDPQDAAGQRANTRKKHNWIHNLPFKMKFRTSGLYISVIPPVIVGVLVGILAAIMGVGGGFIMVPAMIYLLGMPTKVVVGTSLFQIIFVTAFTTLLHATTNFTVDMVLAVLLAGRRRDRRANRHPDRRKAEGRTIAHPAGGDGACWSAASWPSIFWSCHPSCTRLARRRGIDVARVDLCLLTALPAGGRRSGGGAQPEPDFDHHEFRWLGNSDLRRGQARGHDSDDPPLQVIITVAGPSVPMTVRRKEKRLGISG